MNSKILSLLIIKLFHLKLLHIICYGVIILSFTESATAQDLDPRAYARVPVDMKFIVAGLVYTSGGVVSDPASPIQDLEAKVESPMIGLGISQNFFGLTSQVFAAIPYMWAQLNGKVLDEDRSTTRAGLGDLRMRLAVLLYGAPAASLQEFSKQEASPVIIGTSLSIIAPTGQYFTEKLINVGTNRWSFKPEVGISYRASKEWLIDIYAGAWLFTDNNSFYPGTSLRTQEPLYAFQGHISYNFNPLMWAAFDITYYTGGQSSVNDQYKDDRQNNSRLGATINIPVSRQSSIKVAYSRGAIIRVGANFSTISASWQIFFF